MQKKITIDKNKCIHCGMCIKDCMTGCIEFDNEKIPQYKTGATSRCVGCQHCMAICPTGALAFGNRNPDNSSKVSCGNSEDLLNLIKSRRSYRAYKDENIPFEKLNRIKRMLSFAPTGGNANSLHFSIVETKEKMDKIRKITYEKCKNIKNGASILQIAHDSFAKGNDIIYRKAPAMIVVAVDKSKAFIGCETADPIIALSYFELYAQSLELGTLWCDFALMALEQIPEIRDMLKIPENYTLGYVMLFGVPAVEYKRTTQPEPFSIRSIR